METHTKTFKIVYRKTLNTHPFKGYTYVPEIIVLHDFNWENEKPITIDIVKPLSTAQPFMPHNAATFASLLLMKAMKGCINESEYDSFMWKLKKQNGEGYEITLTETLDKDGKVIMASLAGTSPDKPEAAQQVPMNFGGDYPYLSINTLLEMIEEYR